MEAAIKLKKWLRSTILIVLAIAILVILILPRINISNSTDQAGATNPMADDRLSVEYYIATPERFSERIHTTGSVRADEEIELRSEVSGRITQMHFEEGTWVEKGQLLVKINDADLLPQLSRLEFQINLAKIREERQKNLLERQAIAQEDYDVALNEYNTLLAEKDLIKAQIAKTEIRAPFEGFIGLKNVSPGSQITSAIAIASLQKIDTVKIDFSIPERYQQDVQVGQKIAFSLQGNNDTIEGEIYAIEPRIDRETRTLSLRAVAPNEDGKIYPGNYARVELELSASEEAIMIPSEALIPDARGYSVFLYQNGKVTSKEVEAGTRTDTHVMITSGIEPQDSVITTGLLQIREGMEVNVN
ncbi:MAG: efflux RND transporter periplasmic adaptor subunit [Balneolales bacterium]